MDYGEYTNLYLNLRNDKTSGDEHIYELCKLMYEDGYEIELIYYFLEELECHCIGYVFEELFRNGCF